MKTQKDYISRRSFLRSVGACALAATQLKGLQTLAAGQSSNKKRLNILYIMTDQQPLSCLGVYGNSQIRTPNLDFLAKNGCVFTNFYISSFPCCPSRASQFTGRYLHNHLVTENEVMLDKDIPCLGDICKAEGYTTGYFGKWHLGGWVHRGLQNKRAPEGIVNWYYEPYETNEGWKSRVVEGGYGEDYPQHGFDTWAGGWKDYKKWLTDRGHGKLVQDDPWLGAHFPGVRGDDDKHLCSPLSEQEHVEAFTAGQAETFIKKNEKNKNPWLAVASFYAPHHPVAPPKPWDTMYSLDKIPLPTNHNDNLNGKPEQQKQDYIYKLGQWSDEQFKDYIQRYWGYCSYIDSQIGRTFKALKESGQWNNTIIVFTSDHGDMIGSHGMEHKRGTCGYEELFHVPAILSIPGVTKPGSRIEGLVSNIDVLPTLLKAADISCPAKIDGQSLMPLVKGVTSTHREEVFAEGQDGSLVCRSGDYKFVMNWRKKDVMQELYNLKSDPDEMKNQIHNSGYEQIAVQMRERIISWARKTNHKYAELIAKKVESTSSI